MVEVIIMDDGLVNFVMAASNAAQHMGGRCMLPVK